ncbi:SgcJ/EcaC family oxidoreductase [Phenylobacterium deserti]|uniref:DUF4440 domain-containing protein n=1 Tax=Phenylobacterium deserti TaxID=1914756 RepID=A0A328AT10_9CAUL|nr:SgcJ/EcaC family oxidoreductase [Phenylobacterium deserti]RAK57401.1 DUF4440 domain-containing protein [Phenylobacterium deserti]
MFRIAAAALLLLAAPAQAQTPADETAIRDLVGRYVQARDLKDPAAIGALFTPDADQHTTSGEWRRGRDAIVPGALASSGREPGTRRIAVETVRFLSPDIALADGPYTVTALDGAVRRMWATLVVQRHSGAWRIAAIRNAAPTGK